MSLLHVRAHRKEKARPDLASPALPAEAAAAADAVGMGAGPKAAAAAVIAAEAAAAEQPGAVALALASAGAVKSVAGGPYRDNRLHEAPSRHLELSWLQLARRRAGAGVDPSLPYLFLVVAIGIALAMFGLLCAQSVGSPASSASAPLDMRTLIAVTGADGKTNVALNPFLTAPAGSTLATQASFAASAAEAEAEAAEGAAASSAASLAADARATATRTEAQAQGQAARTQAQVTRGAKRTICC